MRGSVAAVMVVCAAALLTACTKSPEQQAADRAAAPAAPAAVPAAAPTDTEKAALLASLPAPYNTADIENGQRLFARCRSCHTTTEAGPNMTGPNLHGVFGRQAGTAPKFKYSEAVKNAGFAWDAEHLDKWLADPRGFLPGNRMSFLGLKEAKERADLIAYLKVETGYKPSS